MLGFGVATCTSFTYWAGFLCISISCCSFSMSAVASDCGVTLFFFPQTNCYSTVGSECIVDFADGCMVPVGMWKMVLPC